jgi:hypothetical protein
MSESSGGCDAFALAQLAWRRQQLVLALALPANM